MEREREREREEHDIGGDDDFVEESSEWIDVQHLDHSDLLDETFDFGKGGNSSLRSSRRRVQKHSAVVLTSQRLKKFTSNSNDSNISANELKHILEDFDEDQEIHHHDHAEQREEVSLATDPTVPHLTHASPSKPPLLATSLLNKISPNSKKSPTQQQSPPSNTTTITVPHQPTPPPPPPPPPPRLKRNKPKITETQAALMILQWWNLKKQKRLLKFTQEGQWPFKTSNKVLAWILGYRVRKIFQSNEIQKIIASQKDLIRVLQELLQQYIHEPKINSPKTKFPVKTVEQTIDYWLTYLQRLQSSQSILPGADQIFAKSVIKQLLAEREKLIKSLYQDSQWIYFPKPGYRLFKREKFIKKGILTSGINKAASVGSPARPSTRRSFLEKKMQDTPPHVKAAIQPAAIKEKAIKKSFKVNQFPATPTGGGGHQLDVVNESLFEDSDRPIKAAKPNHSQTIAENSRHYRKESPNVSLNAHKVLSSLEESRGSSSVLSTNRSHDSSVHNSRSISTPAGGAHTNKGGSSAGVLPNVPRKRNSDGGHIQLEVISGDKLIPAKKGAAKEGNPAADRKPCLKVVFYVPASSAGGNSAPSTPAVPKSPGGAQSDINNGLKKVFQQSKDFNVITLNPKWNCSFIINLPFSKSVLKTIIERNQLQHSYSHAGALNDSEYDTICKAMLQYWSTGTLEIEVFDGERFNEDIFMGKVQLLITSFHPMIKKFHELEMKGNFTLEKSKPKDRVSGSIYLIAYLHVPEKKYVEEQILQVLTSIKYQEIESQNQQQQQQHQNKRKSVSKTSSMYMNEDSSADDGGNDSSSDAYSNKNNRRFSSQAEIKKSSIPTRLSIIPESSASSSSKNNQPTASRNQTITANNFAKKVPMLSSAPTISPPTKTPTSTTPPNTNLSTFMKSFAVQKIQSQDNLNILLGEPNLEESFNINLPAQPAPAISTSSTTSNQHHNHQTPNSIYFRTPSSLYTPQTQQTEGSGNSSASSSVKRPLSARAVSMDPGGSTPPITSLDEIRGSNIHVSSIVSKEAAIESKVVKRNFLEDMAKQLSGLEAIVNQSNDKAIVENISKKLQSKKLSQVIDMNSKSSIPQPKSSKPVNPEDDLARMKSPSRLPSSYHPKATNSPTTSNSTKPVNKAASTYHPGRTSISKGLVDLKLHVNLTVQNLEKFLDDIPLLDPEEEKGDKSSDSDDENPHFTKPFAENHPNKHKKDPLQLTKSSPASKISPSKVPVFQKKYYEQGVDADESDSEQLYEEDEDNQFRKHSVNTPLASARTDSPKKIVSLHHRPLPPPPPPPQQRKTVIISDSDDSDSEDFRIPAKGAFKEDDQGRAYSNASEEHDLEQSKYLEKRISVRDQSNQHIFKYHNPDSPHKHTPSKFSFNAASETTVTTPPQPVSKSSTGNNGIASTKFKSSSKEDESITYLSNSFDYSSPGAVSPVVPPRSSSKQVYEGKSLSQSDIDELSQRVKLLSRLSYSSTDGESHHTQNNSILELSRSKSSEDPKFGNTPLKKIQSTPMKDNDNSARKKVEVVQSPSTNLINQGSVAPSILLPVEKKLPSSIETVSEKQKAIHEIPRSPDFTNRTEGLRVATTPSSIPKFRRGQKDATPIKQPPPPPPPILPSSSTDSIDTPERKKIPPRSAKASATKVAGKEVKKRVTTSRTGKATIHLDEVDL